MEASNGKISVSYESKCDKTHFEILIPRATKAIFKFADKEFELYEGRNEFEIADF